MNTNLMRLPVLLMSMPCMMCMGPIVKRLVA